MKTFAIAAIVLALAGPAMAQPNTLTAAEKAAGWTLLFDGKSVEGWRGFKSPAPDRGWHVVDGTLAPDPKTSLDLLTKETFGSFELSFDWKISPKGNSGVMYHVTEDGALQAKTHDERIIIQSTANIEIRKKLASPEAIHKAIEGF